MEPKLAVKHLTKTFRGSGNTRIIAFEQVSLQVRAGEIVSLIGPSGCGKSSLLDIVAGLSLPDEGQVLLDGESVQGKKGLTSYMPQKDVLFPWRSIIDNVILPLEVNGIGANAAREEAFSLLPIFGLEKFAHNYPSELSGGMKQRASFLRTYLCKREVMLLDEPFGRLDALTRRQMQQWLLNIWEKSKRTLILVTHDVEEAILLSDRIYVFSPRPGQVMKEIKVDLPRPRQNEVSVSPTFMALKMEILQLLAKGLQVDEASQQCRTDSNFYWR